MKITTLRVGTLGLAGLVTTGLLALPLSSATAGDQLLKRDEDTPDVVLVSDDDDDDTFRNARSAASDNTNSRDNDTRTRAGAHTGSRDNSRTGNRSGRDNSYSKQKRDWTTDGPGKRKIDWSQNHTNDRSRNNTRG